jgi:hypothetical protein
MILERDPLGGLLRLRPAPIVRDLHPDQRRALRLIGRWRGVIAGRRSGKSYLMAVWLLGGGAGLVSLYCARTLKSAKSIMLPVFAELNSRYGLGLKIRAVEGEIHEPNGHVIRLHGLKDRAAADLLRGQKYRRIAADECFTSGTLVSPVGAVAKTSSRRAPSTLISVDGVTSTVDHPYLTPEGWIRAEDISNETMLCVWEGFRDIQLSNTHVFEEMSLLQRISCNARERYAHTQASAACKNLGPKGSGNARAEIGICGEVFGHTEAYWAQAEGARRERPWAYVAGVPARECHWLANEPHSANAREANERVPDSLQIGPCGAINEIGCGGGRRKSQHAGAAPAGPEERGVARWQRVESVEVHEQGGAGRYSEVCPDGLVYNLTTESGVYFAGGHLVHNCGAFDEELLEYAIQSVLQPALFDARGDMMIGGTPGPVPRGFFYDLVGDPRGKGTVGRWPTHAWDLRQNPHVGDAEENIAEILLANGWTPDHATFRREVLAQWVDDAGSLIYHYQGEHWAAVPREGKTVLVVDFAGSDKPDADDCAFLVGRQPPELRPHVWLLEGFKRHGINLGEIAALIRQLKAKWGIGRVRVDAGALGAGYAKTLRENYNLDVEAADKRDKRAGIERVVAALDTKTLHICADAAEIDTEWSSLQWDALRRTHHESCADDLSDTCTYLLREFTAQELPSKVITNITEAAAARMRAERKASMGGRSAL